MKGLWGLPPSASDERPPQRNAGYWPSQLSVSCGLGAEEREEGLLQKVSEMSGREEVAQGPAALGPCQHQEWRCEGNEACRVSGGF